MSSEKSNLVTNENFQAALDKKVAKIQQSFDKIVRDIKPFVFDQACDFLREQTKHVTKLLSRQHHHVVDQFIEFKQRTDDQLAQKDGLKQWIAYLEEVVALKTPVMEAEYALDERTTLSLYDCLIPQLKEHRRFKLISDDHRFSINDVRAQQRVLQLEWDIGERAQPRLIDENRNQRKKLEQQDRELETLQWYIDIMEMGIDT